jgi:parallel beta-helix repeat protein
LIAGGSNHVIGGTAPADRNVISGNAGDGIEISSVNGNTIQGNYIGVNAPGTAPLGNGGEGVRLSVSANNTIGGIASGAGNVISANGSRGIFLNGSSGNVIQGNRIGTSASGELDFGNVTDGIRLAASSSNTTIGGASQAAGNVISGNGADGIDIDSSGPATGNVIQRNFIGLSASGSLNLGNAGWGINIDTNTANTTIGGTGPGDGNFIWFNGLGGIRLSADSGTGNAIRGNSIFANLGLGIELAPTGVTPNDPGDVDTGANNLQNFPVIVGASSGGGSTNIQGTLHSSASATFQLDFFSNSLCDESGHGEGRSYLGSTTVNTDGAGNGSFNVTLPVAVAPPGRVAATATDAAGNTSEFSSCVSLAAQFHTLTPCRIADTRNPNGPYGGPALAASVDRSFTLAGTCGIPPTAQAVSLNFTVTGSTGPGHLTVYPAGSPIPLASTMNFSAGQTRANNAIVPLGAAGAIIAHGALTSGTVHLVIDTNGYFE